MPSRQVRTIIHGGRQWTDYRVETALTVHLADHAGIGVRVQGLKRYYAVLLMRPGLIRIARNFDGVVTILAEVALELSMETPYDVAIEVSGREIETRVARDPAARPHRRGGQGLVPGCGSAEPDRGSGPR